MLRSYRSIVVAAVAGLGIFTVGAFSERAAIWANSPNGYPKYYETTEETRERLPTLTVNGALKASVQQQPCAHPEGHDASDLCAQWRAADAAERSSRWAWWQMILSGFGILGLMYSLHLTRAAVESARVAAKEAQASIVTAEEANEIARNLMHTQLRPYLYLKSIIPTFPRSNIKNAKDSVTLILVVENFGQTPAKNVTLHGRGFIGGYWDNDFPSDYRSAATYPLGDIPTGFKKEIKGYTIIDFKEATPDIIDGTRSIFFEGVLSYSDGFRDIYSTQFRLFISGSEDLSRGNFQVARHGNVAT